MKTIIITGAAHGVGKAIARTLSGNKLILVDKDEKALKEISHELKASSFVCDISDTKQLRRLMNILTKEIRTVDCLINNAGVWIAGDISQLSDPQVASMNDLERLKYVVDTNLYGMIAMTQGIAPVMIKQGYGQIINVNSQSGVKTEEHYPVYNATKTGGVAFRKAIQEDLAHHNIRINDVCPGLIKTGFYRRASNALPNSILELGLTVEDVASTVKFLVDLPSHITIPSVEIMTLKSM